MILRCNGKSYDTGKMACLFDQTTMIRRSAMLRTVGIEGLLSGAVGRGVSLKVFGFRTKEPGSDASTVVLCLVEDREAFGRVVKVGWKQVMEHLERANASQAKSLANPGIYGSARAACWKAVS